VGRQAATPAGGKWSKPPCNAANGRAASSTDPLTWSGFDTAAKAYLEDRPRFAGVGFMLHESDPFAGIDLDTP
jgi:primase-polymerase (primpol)-like protein